MPQHYDDDLEPTKEDRLAQRVNKDYERAKTYLKDFHAGCVDRDRRGFPPVLFALMAGFTLILNRF